MSRDESQCSKWYCNRQNPYTLLLDVTGPITECDEYYTHLVTVKNDISEFPKWGFTLDPFDQDSRDVWHAYLNVMCCRFNLDDLKSVGGE